MDSNKLIFGIMGTLGAMGIAGGISMYAMVASLQTKVDHLESDSKQSTAEINRQTEKDKEQKETDRSQWRMFRQELNKVQEKWIEHDRLLYTFHGKELLHKE